MSSSRNRSRSIDDADAAPAEGSSLHHRDQAATSLAGTRIWG